MRLEVKDADANAVRHDALKESPVKERIIDNAMMVVECDAIS